MTEALAEDGSSQDGSQGRWWRWLPKWGWLGLVGLPIIGLAWCLDQWGQAWWNNTLTNVGVTTLFIIPAALIGHSFTDWKNSVNRRTAAAEREASTATSKANTAAQESQGAKVDVEILTDAIAANGSSLAGIREELIADQVAESEKEHSIYSAVARQGDRASLIAALKAGRETGLISQKGVRAPVWETDLHLRFLPSSEDSEILTVNLEWDDGSVASSHIWTPELDPVTFYKQLTLSVKKLGQYVGTGLFDPLESVERLAEALEYASRYRADGMRMGSDNVHDIIEFVDGWYITDHGMFPKHHEYYRIAATRLWEMDWESHISGKSWGRDENIITAIAVARALHGDQKPLKDSVVATD